VRPPKPREKVYIMQTMRPNNFTLSEETKTIIDVNARKTLFVAAELAESRPTHKRARPEAMRASENEGHRQQQRARVLNDELGEYINLHAKLYQGRDWEEFIREVRGRGDLLEPSGALLEHPASNLLHYLGRHGVPSVSKMLPWSDTELEYRLSRGSHKSCDEHLDFLRGEMLEFVQKGFWTVLPYSLLKEGHQQKLRGLRDLRLSPLGIIPQRDRRPRLIVDYSFYEVNSETVPLGPQDAMQFGRTLERILRLVRNANERYGPVYLGKVDLADGFYRVWLAPGTVPKLAVAFPNYAGEEPMVALPLALPMGWVDSVPFFCACTETVADLANSIPTHVELGPHILEDLANTPPLAELEPLALNATVGVPLIIDPLEMADAHVRAPLGPRKVLRPFHKPVRSTDVYVDDFIQCVQGNQDERLRYLRHLLHSIDLVFRPIDEDDNKHRVHVASVKKMLKGDAYMSTRKTVLGWIIDTIRGTLELPPHRIERLHELFDYLRGRNRVGLSKWRKILGELRSMSLGVPGSRGLFSMLQDGLRYTDRDRIRLTAGMHEQLADFEYLAGELGTRPTAIAEIVPDDPVAVGPHDASGLGMGGVWLPATTHSNLHPMLWRERFPDDIIDDLVTFKNPHGTVNNSQLEFAGGLAHQDVLVQAFNCDGQTIAPLGDNTPSGVWHHKGSTTGSGITACLLGINSLHQRHYRYLAKESYISGPANQMADDCSRLWHLTDSHLLDHFNSMYPQTQSWQLAHLRPDMLSAITSALHGQRPAPQLYLGARAHKTITGAFGNVSLPLTKASTPTSYPTANESSYLFSKYSLINSGGASSHPAVDLFGVDRWRTMSGPSVRRSPWWMKTASTHATPTPAGCTQASIASNARINVTTHHRSASSQFLSNSSDTRSMPTVSAPTSKKPSPISF